MSDPFNCTRWKQAAPAAGELHGLPAVANFGDSHTQAWLEDCARGRFCRGRGAQLVVFGESDALGVALYRYIAALRVGEGHQCLCQGEET